MSKLAEFGEFEQIVMSFALGKGRVEYNDVSSQIEPLVKEKGSSLSAWETFNQTIAKLIRRELLDDKNRPNPLSLPATSPEILQHAIYKANKRIEELQADLEKVAKERSEVQSRVYTLERDTESLKRRLDNISPPTIVISKDSLERGVDHFVGYALSVKLSATARSDLENAIRCLSCGIPTAAAMVSLRASEDAMRKYYELKFG